MKRKTMAGGLSLLMIAGAAAGYAFFFRDRPAVLNYRTARVERGSLSSQVVANGTVNPVITVLVGSQVSGTVQNLYADYNTRVKKGDLIAQIDPATFKAQLSQAAAKVQSAKAAVATAEADTGGVRSNLDMSKANVTKAEVAVADTRRNLNRNAELYRQNLIAASEKDAAQTAYDSALAQLEAARAQQKAAQSQLESSLARLPAARASLKQAEAEMEIARLNLDHTRINAPVNGIVISRNVDVGQTVAASLQAPTLFTIAQDLTEMQVEANVSEADIGRVTVGQDTTFTVDAFPQTVFRGKVTDIRNSPVTVQNVVSYIVVIQVKNPELRLRPGMTANASILVAQREDALKIPNAALRFRPARARREPGSAQPKKQTEAPRKSSGGGSGNLQRLQAELNLTNEQQEALARISRETRREIAGAGKDPEKESALRQESRSRMRALLSPEQQQKFDQMSQRPHSPQPSGPVYRIWLPMSAGGPQAVAIVTGISDGLYTEVVSGELREGQEIIVGEAGGGTAKAAGRTAAPGFPGFGGRRGR